VKNEDFSALRCVKCQDLTPFTHYEEPEDPDLILNTEKFDVKTLVKKVLELFDKKQFINFNDTSQL